MPRRNIHLIVGLTVVCLMCAMRASRYGRVLVFAMNQIDLRYLEDVDERELFEGALEGMMNRLDEYSAYITPEMVAEFEEELEKEFGGVGIEIMLDPDTKQLIVASPLVGTPAYEAGILAGDMVLRIDGESTQGLSLADAAERMRGDPGDPVTLTILHQGEKEPVDVEVIRAVIQVDTVLGDTRNADGSWNYFLEGYDRIGYLRINSFAENTDDDLGQALAWLVEHGMQGLILDLRNDPGGMLSAAIGVCDLFIDSGVIVSTRRRDGRIKQEFTAQSNGTYTGFPMAVLVNHFSASASEIVAACLQDHKRAVVVGQRTYGKGTVQELIELEPEQGILKLTTASYWRPSEKNIHRRRGDDDEDDWGVIPDDGYKVEIDAREQERLFLARRQRDVHRSNQEADGSGKEGKAEPYLDPQLERAIEYVERALRRRR